MASRNDAARVRSASGSEGSGLGRSSTGSTRPVDGYASRRAFSDVPDARHQSDRHTSDQDGLSGREGGGVELGRARQAVEVSGHREDELEPGRAVATQDLQGDRQGRPLGQPGQAVDQVRKVSTSDGLARGVRIGGVREEGIAPCDERRRALGRDHHSCHTVSVGAHVVIALGEH